MNSKVYIKEKNNLNLTCTVSFPDIFMTSLPVVPDLSKPSDSPQIQIPLTLESISTLNILYMNLICWLHAVPVCPGVH